MFDALDGGGGQPPPLPGAQPGTHQNLLGRARVVLTPYPFGVSDADNLRIVSVNSAPGITIEIHGRQAVGGFESKPFRYVHTPNSNRTAKTDDFVLGAGLVTNLSVFAADGSPLIGQTFVMIQLIRSMGSVAYVMGTLLAGYVTSTQGLGWPGSAIESSIEGGGYIRVVQGTQPAAGADIVETVPTGARWEPLAFDAALTTSAAAGTRQPALFIDDGANQYAASVNPQVIGAAANIHFNWSPGMPITTAFPGFLGLAGLPIGLRMLAGHRIRTNTAALAAGDQWAAPRFVVREWLEAA